MLFSVNDVSWTKYIINSEVRLLVIYNIMEQNTKLNQSWNISSFTGNETCWVCAGGPIRLSIIYVIFQRWFLWRKRSRLAVGKYLVTIWAGGQDVIKYFRGFPHFFQVNTKIMVQLCNKSLFTHYAQFIFAFHPTLHVTQTATDLINQSIGQSISYANSDLDNYLRKNK